MIGQSESFSLYKSNQTRPILYLQLFDLISFPFQVKRSFGLCNLQLTYFDEENEEVRVKKYIFGILHACQC